jgi:hypothetical protein
MTKRDMGLLVASLAARTGDGPCIVLFGGRLVPPSHGRRRLSLRTQLARFRNQGQGGHKSAVGSIGLAIDVVANRIWIVAAHEK